MFSLPGKKCSGSQIIANFKIELDFFIVKKVDFFQIVNMLQRVIVVARVELDDGGRAGLRLGLVQIRLHEGQNRRG